MKELARRVRRALARKHPRTQQPKALHSKLRARAQARVNRRMERAAHESDWNENDAGLVEIWDDGFCSYPFCSKGCCD